jgi:hypothetical protein
VTRVGGELSKVVVEAARDAGVQLRSFRPERTTLEDVFVEVVGAGGAV